MQVQHLPGDALNNVYAAELPAKVWYYALKQFGVGNMHEDS